MPILVEVKCEMINFKNLFKIDFLGDSGTGLYLSQNETYFVAGVTSFGVSCNTSLPAFYTRVYKYLDWIENIVWKD